jgi:hypothetical protein
MKAHATTLPYSADKLVVSYEVEEFNPVTTAGWRWQACELMANSLHPSGECIPCATMATDVWSFAMTVIEVRILYLIHSTS